MENQELVILEDTGVKIYVPNGAQMVHVNFDIPYEDGSGHKNTLRQVYRRSNKTKDGLVVFEHRAKEDR